MENIEAFALNYCEQIVTSPDIIVGAMQLGPEDPNPSALICISYPSFEEASTWAKFFMSCQTGVDVYKRQLDSSIDTIQTEKRNVFISVVYDPIFHFRRHCIQ